MSIIYDMPDADYRKAEGVSCSMLKVWRQRRSARHTRAMLAAPKPPSEAMAFGTALHASLLTPELPPCWVVIPEDAPKRPTKAQVNAKSPSTETLAAVAWWKAWEAHAKGRVVLTPEQGGRLDATVDAFRRHPLAPETVRHGKAEVSVFSPFALGGTVMRKGRVDFVPDGAALVDLKTCASAAPACVGERDEFSDQIWSFDYDMQAAYYLDLWNAECAPEQRKEEFVFVAMDWCEHTKVCGIRVMACANEVIRSGRDKYIEALTKWMECEQQGWSSGYSAEMETVKLPDFAGRKYRQEVISA